MKPELFVIIGLFGVVHPRLGFTVMFGFGVVYFAAGVSLP